MHDLGETGNAVAVHMFSM